MTFENVTENELRKVLLAEIVKAAGLPDKAIWRKFINAFFGLPVKRFSKLGFDFDQMVNKYGFKRAINICLKLLVKDVEIIGKIEAPNSGPLLVVSNHPGTYDALCLASKLPRDDVKIVSSNIPFLKIMKNVNDHFLFTSIDSYVRMIVIRNAIRHLEKGGALIIFPSGHMDPEPACMAGAMTALNEWSKSIEIFLKKVPETMIQVAVVSHVLEERFLSNPLTHLRKGKRERQRIAEFLQVVNQMVHKSKFNLVPVVSFAKPFKLKDINMQNDTEKLLPYIIGQAKKLMISHLPHY